MYVMSASCRMRRSFALPIFDARDRAAAAERRMRGIGRLGFEPIEHVVAEARGLAGEVRALIEVAPLVVVERGRSVAETVVVDVAGDSPQMAAKLAHGPSPAMVGPWVQVQRTHDVVDLGNTPATFDPFSASSIRNVHEELPNAYRIKSADSGQLFHGHFTHSSNNFPESHLLQS